MATPQSISYAQGRIPDEAQGTASPAMEPQMPQSPMQAILSALREGERFLVCRPNRKRGIQIDPLPRGTPGPERDAPLVSYEV